MRAVYRLLGLCAAAAFPLAARAEAPSTPAPPSPEVVAAAPDSVAEVYVWGRRADAIGQPESASEGVVSFARFAERPLLRPGELAEVVPGLAATQHSGSGKANQYFLRGFNLDHGTDFSVSLDGVPLNLRTHGHGQGYLDLNGVIPETIETIGYHKGPYFAELGDFSAAGGAAFRTFEAAPPAFIDLTAGENDYYRALGVVGAGRSWVAVDLESYRGPWVVPENSRKIDVIGRLALGDWSITGLAYSNRWTSTDQIPQRAVDQGLISRLGAIDPTDGGKTTRFLLAANRKTGDGWTLNAYVQRYTLQLWNDFTYFLDDPVHGDQFSQVDQRWVFGGSAVRQWPGSLFGFDLRSGIETRYDDIGKVGLYATERRNYLSTVRQDDVDEYSGALWTEAARAFGPVRVTLGARLDGIGAHVSSDDPRNGGSAGQVLVSPKLAAAWRVSPSWEFYGDYGRGFHSNDARGATIAYAPGTNDPVTPVSLFSVAEGGEVGARFQRGGFTATAALWTLHLESELVYQGDGGDTASSGATRRTGVELVTSWRPFPGLELNATGAYTDARFEGHPADGDRIPNALEYVFTAGASLRLTSRATASLTLRDLGPAPLTQDGLHRSNAAILTNGLIDYDFGRFRLRVEALNLLDSRGDDIRYFYTSRLPGEPAEGVDDDHFHPIEPRTLRVSVRVPL